MRSADRKIASTRKLNKYETWRRSRGNILLLFGQQQHNLSPRNV